MNPKHIISFRAATAITDHVFVRLNSEGEVEAANGDDDVIGAVEWEVEAGRGVGVVTSGVARLRASEGIKPADLISTGNDGRAVAVEDGRYFGIATNKADADTFVDVLLVGGFKPKI